MIVVDASVMVQIITEPNASTELFAVLEKHDVIAAPHLIDLEVLNALRKHVAAERMTSIQAADAIAAYQSYAIARCDVTDHIKLIWTMKDNVTPYDAAYVVLAQNLEVPFLTKDTKLTRAIQGLAKITLL
jgi:predicted nucleic acid-binding protein